MSKIVGIDASLTATGIVILDWDTFTSPIYHSTVIASKQDGVSRLIEIREQVRTAIQGADLAVIEGYGFATKGQAHYLGELGGVLRTMIYESGVKLIEVAPSQVKKVATGKGNCDKNLILLNVYKRWGAEFQTDHEADAYVLARIGAAYLGHVVGLTALQLGVVDEIRNGKAKKAKKGKGAA